jgi:membrane fusion protein (multidrug efflux system)
MASGTTQHLTIGQKSGTNPWLIAITVTLATFIELLDTAIANVSLPHIAGGLATSYDDRVRYQGLVEGGVVSRLEFDAREAEAIADGEILAADRATVISEQHKVAQAHSLIAQKEAQVEAARTAPQQVKHAQAKSESSMGQVSQSKADVRTAELNLGYTKIYAPVSGIIGRKTVELG